MFKLKTYMTNKMEHVPLRHLSCAGSGRCGHGFPASAGPVTVHGMVKDVRTREALSFVTMLLEGTAMGAPPTWRGRFTVIGVRTWTV